MGRWQTMMKYRIAFTIAVFLVVLAILMVLPEKDDGPPDYLVTFMAAGGNATFSCEVADTDAERAQGLMNRESLAPGDGMLFIFEEPQNMTFWMKNTLIPLDIIFVAENGTVLNIAEAVPEPGVADADLTRYSSAGPALYVVEVNGGLCEEKGIAPGDLMLISYPGI